MSLIAQYLFQDNGEDSCQSYHATILNNISYENRQAGSRYPGKAVISNGQNSQILLPAIPIFEGSGTRSTELWFYSVASSPREILFSSATSMLDMYVITIDNGKLYLLWTEDHSNIKLIGSVSAGMWHHLVCILENGINKFYLDGSLLGTCNVAVSSRAEGIAIGSCITLPQIFNGKFANFRIYDHALAPEEIAAHYSNEKKPENQIQFRSDDLPKWRERFGNSLSNGDGIVNGNLKTNNGLATLIGVKNSLVANFTDMGCFDGIQAGKIDDTVLIHQTRGVNAGAWQLNKITARTGSQLTFKYPLIADFTLGAQITSSRLWRNLTVDGLTYIDPWDGNTGGIIFLTVKNKLIINGKLLSEGTGFIGGEGGNDYHGQQGEGINGIGSLNTGANINGGGGGFGHNHDNFANATGGGGGHLATGGDGQAAVDVGNWERVGAGGSGGAGLGSLNLRKLYFGGGGGGGSAHQSNGWHKGGSGGNGGGIIVIIAKEIIVNNNVNVNGNHGNRVSNGRAGSGGGGAAGSILMICQSANLMTNQIVAAGGLGAANDRNCGGNGANGRIAVLYEQSLIGTTNPGAWTEKNELYQSAIEGGIFINKFID